MMTTEDTRCCLIIKDSNAQIPLCGVKIEATLHGLCARVEVTHRYRNTESRAVEAVYVFPLEEGAAVCGFEAQVGDRRIVGEVEEKDRAFERYDDAIAEGHGAFLLDQERPNIFTASLGNLEPGTDVTVQLTYVALLNHDGDAVRFTLPTTVSPRYAPASEPTVGEPDEDRVNPQTWISVPYGMSLTVHIHAGSALRTVESPSHTIRTELDGNKATVTLSQESTAMDRDFVLLLTAREPRVPTAQVGREEDGTRVVMVNFLPSTDDLGVAGGQEITFILDCSGSMGGESIRQARRALELCVRAMSEGDTFNIIPFGSDFTSLWKEPAPYNQSNLDEAVAYIQARTANLGGTEILRPLDHALARAPDPARPRKVLLLTDGEVANEEEVIALARKHRRDAHIFTFGIGAGCSEHLIRGVARASRAAAEFIYPGERIEPKVLRMFGRVRTPVLGEISLDWGQMKVETASSEVPPVFGGDALTTFARVRGGQTSTVTLRAGDRSWAVPLDLEIASADGVISTLWARKKIEDLELSRPRRGSNQKRGQADRTAAKIIDLGIRYGLMSKYTSYVAIEERQEGEKTSERADLRRIPVALTTGWGNSAHSVTFGALPQGPPITGEFGAVPMPAAAAPSRFLAMSLPPAACAPRARKRSKPPGGGLLQKLGAAVGINRSNDESEYDRAQAPSGPNAGPDLYDLLLTQRADGSFPLGETLFTLTKSAKDELRRASIEHGEAVVATTIALQILVEGFADREDEWRAAANKAQRWLDSKGSTFHL
jgi:Ca-activated chloride channel family protein